MRLLACALVSFDVARRRRGGSGQGAATSRRTTSRRFDPQQYQRRSLVQGLRRDLRGALRSRLSVHAAEACAGDGGRRCRKSPTTARPGPSQVKPGIYFTDDPAFKGKQRELVADDYVYSHQALAGSHAAARRRADHDGPHRRRACGRRRREPARSGIRLRSSDRRAARARSLHAAAASSLEPNYPIIEDTLHDRRRRARSGRCRARRHPRRGPSARVPTG